MKGSDKTRLDALLVERRLAETGNRARALVMSGRVAVDGKTVDKPGTSVGRGCDILVRADPGRFVSRGGLKLEKALREFGIEARGKTALDIGASTGGFTDCLLRFGASRVYAFDVGRGQLDWNLRNDGRVVVRERINCRYLRPEDVGEKVDLVTIDVSFISLTMMIKPALSAMAENGTLIALVKPQFEVGKGQVGKGGIVRDEEKLEEVNAKIISHIGELGLEVKGMIESPIKGARGNREFLVCARGERLSTFSASRPETSRDPRRSGDA